MDMEIVLLHVASVNEFIYSDGNGATGDAPGELARLRVGDIRHDGNGAVINLGKLRLQRRDYRAKSPQ